MANQHLSIWREAGASAFYLFICVDNTIIVNDMCQQDCFIRCFQLILEILILLVSFVLLKQLILKYFLLT